jgi:hypothetical protein
MKTKAHTVSVHVATIPNWPTDLAAIIIAPAPGHSARIQQRASQGRTPSLRIGAPSALRLRSARCPPQRQAALCSGKTSGRIRECDEMSFCNLRSEVRVDSRSHVHIALHSRLRTDRAAATSGAIAVTAQDAKALVSEMQLRDSSAGATVQ